MASPQKQAEETKKIKKPTTIKRQMQSEKKRLRNKADRTRVKSHVKIFLSDVSSKKLENAATSLQEIYSLVDKAVKKGVYKKNKASRVKARMAARLVAVKKA